MSRTKITWESVIRLTSAIIILLGVLLTPIWGPLLGHRNNQSQVAECEAGDGSSFLCLRDLFDDIESRPLAQQAITAKQYCGVRIVKEPLWLYDISEEPDTGVFHLTLSMDSKLNGSNAPKRMVVCTISRALYPALIGARKGLKIHVSGKVREVESQQIYLTGVSLIFLDEDT